MISRELLQKIRRIEITTSRLVSDVFAGEYHSVFKGEGIEFEEVREYQPGDDIRTIDWNVTARMGRVYVKKFVEERELTVMIMVDASGSCLFASVNMLKIRLAAEISALLALSAIRNNDKVGLIVFSDKVDRFIPPRKGRRHVLRVIREILYIAEATGSDYKPNETKNINGTILCKGGTDIVGALEYLNKITTRSTISFLISDFLDEGIISGDRGIISNDSLKKTLAIANKRHDMIAITLNDPREYELPDCGIVALRDAESGEDVYIDCSDKRVREEYRRINLLRIDKRERMFRSVGVDYVNISTAQPYTDALVRFFMRRRKMARY